MDIFQFWPHKITSEMISTHANFAWLSQGNQDFQGEWHGGLSEGHLLCFLCWLLILNALLKAS